MSEELNASTSCNSEPVTVPCQVTATTKTPFTNTTVPLVTAARTPTLKVPVVIAERTIQVVAEADIPLNPPASEIKRVLKDVILTQCKLVPVEFAPIAGTNFVNVTRAKLFIEGFIRKNIEYATADCNGFIRDRIANLEFSGFTELTAADFILFPVLSASTESRARFINPKNGDLPRLDKYFFENNVYYNEQPFCELVRADFFELDFSPTMVNVDQTFGTLRDKVVMDVTVKVLQTQQIRVTGSQVFPGPTTSA